LSTEAVLRGIEVRALGIGASEYSHRLLNIHSCRDVLDDIDADRVGDLEHIQLSASEDSHRASPQSTWGLNGFAFGKPSVIVHHINRTPLVSLATLDYVVGPVLDASEYSQRIDPQSCHL
jgi:hypothetical protein